MPTALIERPMSSLQIDVGLSRFEARLGSTEVVAAPNWAAIANHADNCRRHVEKVRQVIGHAEAGIHVTAMPTPWAPPSV